MCCIAVRIVADDKKVTENRLQIKKANALMICTSDSYVPHMNASFMGALSHALGTLGGKKTERQRFSLITL